MSKGHKIIDYDLCFKDKLIFFILKQQLYQYIKSLKIFIEHILESVLTMFELCIYM
jgi:hypothetical protein